MDRNERPGNELRCVEIALRLASDLPRLAKRKVENIRRTGARIVLAANAGCLLQIGRELRQAGHPVRLMHPMELLDLSYREKGLGGNGQ